MCSSLFRSWTITLQLVSKTCEITGYISYNPAKVNHPLVLITDYGGTTYTVA